MGQCCTRQNISNESMLDFTSVFFKNIDEKNKIEEIKLNLESKEFDTNIFNDNINSLILYFEKSLNVKVKKFTFVEIYNINVFHQDNYTNTKYLLYDLRTNSEQRENFLKKMKRINYHNEEIKVMSNNRKNNFKNFLNKENIIIIFSPDFFEKENNEESKEIISNFLNLKIEISINILNTNLKEDSLSPFTKKLYYFLENTNYDLLPYVLLTYSHILNQKKEGYIFIQFNSNLSFENIQNENNLNQFLDDFINAFNIYTIINIDNEEKNKYNFKQFQEKDDIYREIEIGYYEYENNKINTEVIGNWIKKDIKMGKSIIFNIQNYNETNNNWILIILLFIVMGVPVKISQIINYLNVKIIFINDFKLKIEENLSNFTDILNKYGIPFDI